jgi:Transposase
MSRRRRLEISEPTDHRWRNQYGGMKGEDARRLTELEGENARLKKIVADKEPHSALGMLTPGRVRLAAADPPPPATTLMVPLGGVAHRQQRPAR